MNNRLLIGLILFSLLSTYTFKKNDTLNLKLNMKEIQIENNFIISDDNVLEELKFLYDKNLFFLKNDEVKKALNNNNFIESFKIKKIFPNKLKVQVFEKKPIFILHERKKKYYYTDKNELLDYVKIEKFESLPIVFGNKKSLKIFYQDLKKIDFPFTSIETLYFFESKRWDLKTKENKLIKLPVKNYVQSLENFLDIKDKDNFAKYKTFDYRISDQLILK